MKQFVSYHNDPAVKEKYVMRFAAHREMDQVTQGLGFDDDTGRGCFVGCTLNKYDHSAFETELGWPEWLARLADSIFEGLPKEEAPQFGTDLLAAVPVGVDLDPIKHKLAMARIDRLIELQKSNLEKHGADIDAVIQQTLAALAVVRRCHESEAGGSSCDWSAAESAAWSAESAAWSAAESARSARSAESAARSAAESAARSAAESARSAAWSAESAARSAAWSARSAESAWTAERDTLLELLRAA